MAAPVSIVHTHVQSMRIANGAEALVARVLTAEGVAGFGFTLNLEAIVARDMAAWDAFARSRGVPFHAVLGQKRRDQVAVVVANDQGPNLIDPFEAGSIEAVRSRAAGAPRLLAPNAHPWELAYCAALTATLEGNVCIEVHGGPSAACAPVPDGSGFGIDWSLEPEFATLRWIP